MYLAAGADSKVHRCEVPAPEGVELEVVAVPNYQAAEAMAHELAASGAKMIELCAGFGHEGACKVANAVGGSVPVGVVRFDGLPVLDYKSGDTVFGK